MTSLTEAVLRYQSTGKGFGELIQQIHILTYRYPRMKFGWDEDACGDFFCSIFARLPGLVERYRYSGISFEAYLYATLRWQMKTFYEKCRRRCAYDRVFAEPVFWVVKEPVQPLLPDEPVDLPDDLRRILSIDTSGVITDRAYSIRILCLTLRNCEFMNDDMVRHISILCGCTISWLTACVLHLRSRMEGRRMVIQRLQRKRNGIFLKICLLHDELNLEPTWERSCALMETIERERSNLRELSDRIKRYPLFPTHREIAQVLGLPKGSVDSGLFYLKTTFERLSQSG